MTDYLLYLAIGVFVALGTTSAIVVLYPPKRVMSSMMIIAVMVIAPLFLYNPVLNSLGYPVKITEKTTAKFLAYSVSPDSLWIYLWTNDKDAGEPRAYRIPYSKEDEEELAKAEKEKGKGIPQQVEMGPEAPEGHDSSEGVLNFEPLPDGGGAK